MKSMMLFIIPLFLNLINIPFSSTVPVADADANADPNADPMNIMVDVYQNVGDQFTGSDSLNNIAPELNVPEEVPEVPTTQLPTTEKPVCPDDFFMFGPSNKCYKYVNDVQKKWNDADEHCMENGWQMAKVDDPVAFRLYLVNDLDIHEGKGQLGITNLWLGAIGIGGTFMWKSDRSLMDPINSPYWAEDADADTVLGYCVSLETAKPSMEMSPDYALISEQCNMYGEYHFICELA